MFVVQVVTLVVIISGVMLARRNIRLGRSDRRGAFRFAVVYIALGALSDVFRLSGGAQNWLAVTGRNLALQISFGALVWIFYVAIEPCVRRLWPTTLIAWSRALEGRFRDPLVGRHLLLGSLAGLGFSALFMMPGVIAPWVGLPAPAPPSGGLVALAGARQMASLVFNALQQSFFIPVAALLTVLMFRVIFRKPWLAYVALFTLLSIGLLASDPSTFKALFAIASLVFIVVLLTRLGLLAFLTAIAFSSWTPLALTTDTNSWFFPTSVVTMLLFAGLAVYAFVVSLGGQAVFEDSVLD